MTTAEQLEQVIELQKTQVQLLTQIMQRLDERAVGRPEASKPRPLVITGIDIPLEDMMTFLVKLLVAAIPAGIIYAIVVYIGVPFVLGFLNGISR